MKPRLNIYLAGGMLQGVSADTADIDVFLFVAEEEDSDEWDMATAAPVFVDINDVDRHRARIDAGNFGRD
jgi:hypothetical protein